MNQFKSKCSMPPHTREYIEGHDLYKALSKGGVKIGKRKEKSILDGKPEYFIKGWQEAKDED